MDTEQLNSLKSANPSKLIKEYFSTDFRAFSSVDTLADKLSRLNIANTSELFDPNVSRDTLERFQHTLTTIGQTGIKQETDDINYNLKAFKLIRDELEDDFMENNLSFGLDDEARKKHKTSIEQMNQKRQQLVLDLKEAQNNQKHLPLTDKFRLEEEAKNAHLIKELNLLKSSVGCTENINNALDLEKRIAELDRFHKKMLTFDYNH